MAEDWNKPNVIVYTMYAITIYKLIRLAVPLLLSKTDTACWTSPIWG